MLNLPSLPSVPSYLIPFTIPYIFLSTSSNCLSIAPFSSIYFFQKLTFLLILHFSIQEFYLRLFFFPSSCIYHLIFAFVQIENEFICLFPLSQASSNVFNHHALLPGPLLSSIYIIALHLNAGEIIITGISIISFICEVSTEHNWVRILYPA